MPPTPDRPSLPRVLGLVDVTASGVGIIVGAGIYVLLGPATERAGGLVWLAFVLSAVVCGLTALSYAELSSVFPRAGGEYEYARHSMHRHGAFMVGWTMLAGLTVAGATVALGFARYFNYFWPIGSRWAGLGLLVAMSSLAALGIRRSTWVVVVFSVIQIGGLLFVSAVGRFELIASATDVAVYATFLFVNFIVIALRVRRPDMVRPFRVPISIGRVPVVPVVATVVTIWMVALLELRAIAVAGAIMSVGLVMSLVRGSLPKSVR